MPDVPAVLVVDDDRQVRQLVQLTLADRGYRVFAASSCDAALSASAGHEIDAVVLDLHMPGTDGCACFRHLRDAGVDAPVLVLSAYGAREARGALGADDALAKPFDPRELARRVESMLLS